MDGSVTRPAPAAGAAAAATPAAIPGDGWAHVKKSVDAKQKPLWTCSYCSKSWSGRNVTRVRATTLCSLCMRQLSLAQKTIPAHLNSDKTILLILVVSSAHLGREGGLVNPPRRDTRAFSPAGMLNGKAPPRQAAQKSRPHAHLRHTRCAPAYFHCKWGVLTRLD